MDLDSHYDEIYSQKTLKISFPNYGFSQSVMCYVKIEFSQLCHLS